MNRLVLHLAETALSTPLAACAPPTQPGAAASEEAGMARARWGDRPRRYPNARDAPGALAVSGRARVLRGLGRAMWDGDFHRPIALVGGVAHARGPRAARLYS